jgi:putative SOS response-associated peptidase YedK
MCGLYSFRRSTEEVRALFAYAETPDFPPRPYVAPGGPIAIVRRDRGARHFALVRWGFVPSWSKEVRPGRPLINARAETVLEKPAFRNALARRRGLVPADGWYEWRGEPGRKRPFHIHKPGHALFAFAGLWEAWLGPDGSELESAAIVTTAASPDTAHIHARMPVALDPACFEDWLDAERVPARAAAALLAPPPAGTFLLEPAVMERAAPARRSQPSLL